MALRKKIAAILAALTLSSGIAAAAVHGTTANASGNGPVTGTGTITTESPGGNGGLGGWGTPCVWPYNAE
jgi:hypothetical protein